MSKVTFRPSSITPALSAGLPGSDNDQPLRTLQTLVTPLSWVIVLLLCGYAVEGDLLPPYLLLSILVFALTFPGRYALRDSVWSTCLGLLVHWLWIAVLLALTGFATGYYRQFSETALLLWLALAPACELFILLVLRASTPSLLALQGPRQRCVIVGMNPHSLGLARRIGQDPFSRTTLLGFVDSRAAQRLQMGEGQRMLGPMDELATLVQSKRIDHIYLSLPMDSQPRILQLLDALKDTTASIYFLPDLFVTDLIQAHSGQLYGVPVISVCDTPFRGMDAVTKRASDLAFSSFILVLLSPLLLAIALAIKWTSPGPVIFRQRRYGLDGQEILVYKFRSMRVTEDGNSIAQATRHDSRITPLGAFLRRSSLDELPQFLNVLQGRMSIVGPRPHAVAHNELYRTLIKGYMVRHKVKPGITGWAQINGFRGETDTLAKMQGRIDHDLNYLRHWSLRLDISIILRTVRLVLGDSQAY